MEHKAQSHPNARTCLIGFDVSPLTQNKPSSGLVRHSGQRHLVMFSSESTSSFLDCIFCPKCIAIGDPVIIYIFLKEDSRQILSSTISERSNGLDFLLFHFWNIGKPVTNSNQREAKTILTLRLLLSTFHTNSDYLDVLNWLLHTKQTLGKNCHITYGVSAFLASHWLNIHSFTIRLSYTLIHFSFSHLPTSCDNKKLAKLFSIAKGPASQCLFMTLFRL